MSREGRPGTTGNFSLNGKSNVVILIEGRPTYLSAQDLAAYLKSLPAGVLDKLELMDNPPARFDASGGAVINIRLKKNKATGLTGHLNAGLSQGQKFLTNEFIHLYYNKKKLNLFGNTGYGRGANYGLVTNHRIHYDEKGIPVSEILLTTRNEFENNVVFSRLEFDYNLGPETVVGMQVNLQNIPRTESANFESRSIIGAIDSVKSGNSNAAVKWRNLGVNLNFQQKFNKNRELTADLNYLQYQSTGRQDFNNFETLSGTEATPAGSFRYNILAGIHIYNFKADYTIPLKHKAGLEMGIKSSFIENDNDSRYADVQDEIGIPDYGKSNRFIYHENVNAAYFSARKSWRKLGLQAGLRIENSRLEGLQPEYETAKTTRFSQNFTDVFPSLFLTYRPDSSGHNTWTTSLSRRISRPGYQQFNPFMNFRDNYSYSSGNPALKPYYQTQYEVSFLHKQLLTLRAGFGHSDGIILNITEASGNILVSKPLNVASENIWNFSANFDTETLRWWRINYNLQYLISHYRGKPGTENLNTGVGNGRVNLTNLFTINPLWSADFTANYTSRSFQEQTFNRPRCIISGGIQKKVLGNAGTIRLMVEDFLHSWKSRGRMVSIRQTAVYRTSEFDSRRIGIAFSYRFGNEKFTRKRKHTDNAAESESRRAG